MKSSGTWNNNLLLEWLVLLFGNDNNHLIFSFKWQDELLRGLKYNCNVIKWEHKTEISSRYKIVEFYLFDSLFRHFLHLTSTSATLTDETNMIGTKISEVNVAHVAKVVGP